MMHTLRRLLRQNRGITLVELLIGTLLTAVVGGAAMEFYVSQHDSWLTQQNISEAQQSLRVCIQELSTRLRNAGASLPEGMAGIWGSDINPDTLAIRYSASPMSLSVGQHTNKSQAVPIHVLRTSTFEGFTIGDRVYIYRPSTGIGEFFTITDLADNSGTGWKEVHHLGQDLNNDPQGGDVILKLNEVRFWVDFSQDSLHPILMRELNGTPEIYADEICDLQCTFTLTDSSIVNQPAVGDTVVGVDFSLVAQTVGRSLSLAGDAGRLLREAGSHILLRNRPGAG